MITDSLLDHISQTVIALSAQTGIDYEPAIWAKRDDSGDIQLARVYLRSGRMGYIEIAYNVDRIDPDERSVKIDISRVKRVAWQDIRDAFRAAKLLTRR